MLQVGTVIGGIEITIAAHTNDLSSSFICGQFHSLHSWWAKFGSSICVSYLESLKAYDCIISLGREVWSGSDLQFTQHLNSPSYAHRLLAYGTQDGV